MTKRNALAIALSKIWNETGPNMDIKYGPEPSHWGRIKGFSAACKAAGYTPRQIRRHIGSDADYLA